MDAKQRIIVAADVSTEKEAATLMKQIAGNAGGVKLGLQLCTAIGVPAAVELANSFGLPIFLDLKFHDIPNTVAGAVLSACCYGVRWCNLHASSGTEAMQAAADAARPFPYTTALAETVLTSLDKECWDIYCADRTFLVKILARAAHAAKLGGVVCSPLEVGDLRSNFDRSEMQLVVPGIRPAWASKDDQKAFATPSHAIRAGADYLVIGRPVTNPPPDVGSPAEALERIACEIGAASNEYS